MESLRIRTPSRLHFGLFGWGPSAPRQFGGLGLMVDDPGIELVMSRTDEWTATGPLADRSVSIARSVASKLAAGGRRVSPVRIEVERAPREHVGLGVGTQLSMGIARGLTEIAGVPRMPAIGLATLVGRGLRSGIGIHGFEQGGFIVDGGRRDEHGIPVKLFQRTFPADWHVLVVIPERVEGLSGEAERQAFESLEPPTRATSDRLCGLVLLRLLPAIEEHNLIEFGSALSEIQRIVGDGFQAAQGGRFADRRNETLAKYLENRGLLGVGQSSWGPTLYGFSDRAAGERSDLISGLERVFDISPGRAFWTSGSVSGAHCHRI